MSEKLEIHVRSNIDALSERVLHEAFVRTVDDTIESSTLFLRADRAMHTRSGLTEEHIRSEHAHDLGGIIEGKLGITEVTEKDDRATHGRYRHSQAPLFVDAGTHSPIFPARATAMWNRAEGIIGRLFVRGQPAQHFMSKTFGEAQVLVREDKSISLALDAMKAEADAMAAEIEAT